jgi:hypothetical protein
MISSSTLNELDSHFGLKKDKLTWDGTLDELKHRGKKQTNSRSSCRKHGISVLQISIIFWGKTHDHCYPPLISNDN